MYSILYIIPKAYLSWLVGLLASIPLPRIFRLPLLNWYMTTYSVNADEAEFPPETYPSLGAFFVRRLKPGLRPVQGEFVSPVDGTHRRTDKLDDGSLIQVKGLTYSLADLLQDEEMAKKFEGGFATNLYLSPRDYHHVHFPCSGEIVQTTHIPGKLWPVNDWSLNSINGLFVKNERVVTYLKTKRGLVAVVMVGATNVGKMTFAHTSIVTNSSPWSPQGISHLVHEPSIPAQSGDLLGTFHLGSSVILCCQKHSFSVNLQAGQAMRYGESLSD